jgi:hypothetical protein
LGNLASHFTDAGDRISGIGTNHLGIDGDGRAEIEWREGEVPSDPELIPARTGARPLESRFWKIHRWSAEAVPR